ELPDLGAQAVSLSPGREVTLINFWATWCVPCLKEIPELVALHDHGRTPEVRVVGISIASGSRQDVQAFAAKHGMDYLLLDADEEWGRRYFRQLGLPLFLPLTLVVDRHGVIRHRLFGPQTRAQFETAIREAS
ncbi:MAG: TlpA family protein disulfide reductase, partial [Candidatus Rokuibacteriota bacterium]